MTNWANPPTTIQTPEAVIDWLRSNIAPINDTTPLSVQMRRDIVTNIQILDVDLVLSAVDIDIIQGQFPELVGKIVG